MERSSRDERDAAQRRGEAEAPSGSVPAERGPAQLGPAELEEHEWIRRAQQGEEEAFELLVRAHERRAWRVARNMVPGDEDARDLVQEAFLRVFRNLERFDFRHAFATWLYRIVTNLAIDHLRKRRAVVSTAGADEDQPELDLLDHDAPAPSAALEREETAAEVRACLERLAPHFQSALILRELEGLACTEIAEIVGATHVTVRWRLHRGRKLFLEEWERRRRAAEGATRNAANSAHEDPVGATRPENGAVDRSRDEGR